MLLSTSCLAAANAAELALPLPRARAKSTLALYLLLTHTACKAVILTSVRFLLLSAILTLAYFLDRPSR